MIDECRPFRENALLLGDARRLTGILTEPEERARASALLVTAGLTPKFGPFRLYAQLARRLAGLGVRALRFDLGGIGDSAPGPGFVPLRERTRREIADAVAALSAGDLGGSLTLLGLCSGAEDAFRYAAQDERVSGLVLLDAFAYRTAGWVWRDLAIRAARGALSAAGMIPPSGAAAEATLADYEQMGRDECLGTLEALVRRNVRLHFIFTGGMRESFNHEGQFQAMFRGVDFRGLATVDYLPQLRHTQALEDDRRLVIESVLAHWPAAEASWRS